ncbi:hypothetical protein Bca52824_034780 [Brassica carinata]|uniref:Uncharacterized protein n=1 Tax=Brassica carinata TaxID=52824 RepID=A0A8X7S333_BRACI|nr:hypothetical protein Bca52824_034780 [Brassica carinata]
MREHIQSLINKVRGVFYITPMTPLILTYQLPPWVVAPDGDVIPPQNIFSNADIEMMMNMHEWNTEPKLCIIYGAEAVARYQFICRSPFTIGDRTFLGEGINEEDHLTSIKEIMGGVCFRCTMRMLSQIFNEDKAVGLYRFAMEIEKAQNILDLNVGPGDDNDDHIVPTVYGEMSGGNVSSPFSTATGNTWSDVEFGPVYWDSLMSSRYAVELGRIYGVVGSENVGYQQANLIIGDSAQVHDGGQTVMVTAPEVKLVGEPGGSIQGNIGGRGSIIVGETSGGCSNGIGVSLKEEIVIGGQNPRLSITNTADVPPEIMVQTERTDVNKEGSGVGVSPTTRT